jgi:hypothetical protein
LLLDLFEERDDLALLSGFSRSAHPVVIVARSRFPPKRVPHRHPSAVIDLGVEIDFDHRFELTHGVVANARERLLLHLLELAVHVLQRGEQQRLLAVEVEAYDSARKSGNFGDSRHGRPGQTVLRDRFDRRFDELASAAGVAGLPPVVRCAAVPRVGFSGVTCRTHLASPSIPQPSRYGRPILNEGAIVYTVIQYANCR